MFSPPQVLDGLPATEPDLRAWVPGERRHLEHPPGSDPQTSPWAFIVDGGPGAVQVVTDAKEHRVLRPHGHLLRSPAHISPAADAAASTCWMRGVFHSHVTQGHASFDSLIGLRRGYLDLALAHGIRAFVDTGDAFDNKNDFSLRTGVGVGARWRSPIGGVRIDIAHGLDDPDSSFQLYLSLGANL